MQPADISVVIPVHGRLPQLREAVATALSEDPLEVIVVDDASPDPVTLDALNLYDPRIVIARLAVNQGAAAARNHGVQMARGAWVAFLDSDDVWVAGKLRSQCAYIARYPDTRLLAGGFILRRPAGDCLRVPVAGTAWQRALDPCEFSPGSTLLAHKDVFAAAGGYDVRFRRLEDWEWLIRALRVCPIAVVPEPLAIVHGSGHPSLEMVRTYATLLERTHGAAIRRMSWGDWARLKSSIFLEYGVAAMNEAGIWRGLPFFMAAIILRPLNIVWIMRKLVLKFV